MSKRIGFSDIAFGSVRSTARRLAVELGGPARALSLNITRAPAIEVLPEALGLGDAAQGLKLLDGQFALDSQSLDVGKHGDPWSNAAPSEVFAHRLHSFDWLADIAAIGLDKKLIKKSPGLPAQAQERARHLVDRWTVLFGRWNPYAWQNDILAARLFSWLANWQALLFEENETPEGAARRVCTWRQLKRLRRTYRRTPPGKMRLKSAACLVLGGACFDGKQDGLLDRGLDLLDDEIDVQILSDGGHISRNPQQVVQVLEILIVTENALAGRDLQGSREIRRAIDRLTPMVGFFSAGDQSLFGFNGGGTGSAARHKKLLSHAKIKAKPFGYAPHIKYQRLDRNGTVLMIDVGGTPPRPYDLDAHLAPLAFELASPAGRLIVNCGWNERQPRDWREPMRGTAAHSTLILGGSDAGRLLTKGLGQRVLGPAVATDVGTVGCTRKEQETGTWLEAFHEGYLKRFGLTHRRRLYMDILGADIRGEDSLHVPLGATPLTREEIPFEIRFHLHPDVKVTLAQDQRSALLIQPGRKGWRFRTDAGPLVLEKSVYLAQDSKPRRSEQIVIYGRAYGDGDGQTRSNRVRWSLKLMGKVD